jgi:hypothetical protein
MAWILARQQEFLPLEIIMMIVRFLPNPDMIVDGASLVKRSHVTLDDHSLHVSHTHSPLSLPRLRAFAVDGEKLVKWA